MVVLHLNVMLMTREMEYTEALDALNWQIELGADEAICDAPVNRFDVPEPTPKPAPMVETSDAPTDAPAVAAPATAEIAASCADLAALQVAVSAFDGCALKKGARSTVFSDGNPGARVMIVGEAPGQEEDRAGKPFVGKSGQLLDKMFAAIGLSRASEDAANAIYITNVMPWRPPQNRDPSTDEMAMMKPFLLRHIELIEPDVLVTMGNPASKTVLDTATGITRMRGSWAEFGSVPVMPMFHPAALLRDPLKKREAWADLLEIKARLS